MNEHDLMDALEEQVADVAVGPAPVDSMTRSAAGTRRRRGVVAGAVAAVVAVTVGGVAVLPGDDSSSDPAPPVASDTVADVAPEGFRYVGLNQAAIAVPQEWPTNRLDCDVPAESTVLVDFGPPECSAPYPAGTDSVEVREAIDGERFRTWTPVEVDGVAALRSPEGAYDVPSAGRPVYGGRIYLPGEEVVFFAQSSVGADRVDDLLDGVVFLDDQAGVPAIGDLDLNRGSGRADELYLTRLADAGLRAEVVPPPTAGASYGPGTVIDVDPAVGTVVESGSTVRVTVAD